VRRGWPALTVVAVSTLGLVAVVALAPSTGATPGSTTSTNTTRPAPTATGRPVVTTTPTTLPTTTTTTLPPPPVPDLTVTSTQVSFGDGVTLGTPVGTVSGLNITVSNTNTNLGQTDTIDLTKSFATTGAFLDFFPGPAVQNPGGLSCIDFNGTNLIANPIPSGGTCTLGLYFLATHFGIRATSLPIWSTGTGETGAPQFSLSITGAGVAGYYLGGASAEYTTLGFAPTSLVSSGFAVAAPVVGITATDSTAGFWLDAADGGIFTAGDAAFLGSMGGQHLDKPVVGMANASNFNGVSPAYWLVASDGGIFSFGGGGFFGSMGGRHLDKPIVGMAPTPSGLGYWMVASDGGIFAFGDAGFFGSMGGRRLDKPIVGMAASPTGRGYWLVASDGGIFAFGDAGFFGSTGGIPLTLPIVGMAASPTGRGYWFVASDGGIFNFGDVPFEGSLGGQGATDVIGMAPTTSPLFGIFLHAPSSQSSAASRAQVLAAIRKGRLRVNTWPVSKVRH
jgi:hypothetical protein